MKDRLEDRTDAEILFLQNITAIPYEKGDILYFNGEELVRLPIGKPRQTLQVNAEGTALEYV